MSIRKVPRACPSPVILGLAILQMTLCSSVPLWAGDDARIKPKTRADAVRALVSHLGLGKRAVIADIGAGNGKDTWVFADIVGYRDSLR